MRIKFIQKAIDNLKKIKIIDYDPIHFLIAILKLYGINQIIASPGTQNANFNYILQKDSFFNSFSVVDERSAAYVATGLVFESNNPVVITCTGATASRNYPSALTEAFYRNLPVIAVTFYNPQGNDFNLCPQYINRSVTQKDIKGIYIKLNKIKDEADVRDCIIKINVAIANAVYLKKPVHIDCPSDFWGFNDSRVVPEDKIWKIDCYREQFDSVNKCLFGKKIAIFVGSHRKFSKTSESILSKFAKSYDAVVFCDHTSNYHGENKILFSQALDMMNLKSLPDLVIDIGNVTGDYSSYKILFNSEIWRVSEDNSIKFRMNSKVKKVFLCSEEYFFMTLINNKKEIKKYYTEVNSYINTLIFPELPLSTTLVCQYLSKFLPKNSVLNTSILNSLRNMNFFNLDESISFNCNVGGFGIDGAVSTLVGMSLYNKEKKYFGLIGDLAFFYDMNIIGNRHLSNNLRILLVNNNRGEEFRVNSDIESVIGDEVDVLIAAGGHNSSGAKNWAVSNNFYYMSACSKNDFINKIKDFCLMDCKQSILFEVFTNNESEIKALDLIRNANRYEKD